MFPRRGDEEARIHQDKLRQILKDKMRLIEDRIYLCADPREAVQMVFELNLVELQLAETPINVVETPDMVLAALEGTESWYKNRELEYPNSKWLAAQREFWKKKLSGKK